MIHLDTSFLIEALASGTAADRAIRRWLSEGEPIAVSSLVWAEFRCGRDRPLATEILELAARITGPQVPFADAEAEVAADLFNATGRRRGSIVDCMIAATAVVHGAAIATRNLEDFRRFEKLGLRLLE